MVLNDNAGNQMLSGDVEFFASKLAPTGIVGGFEVWSKNDQCSVAHMQRGL